MALPTSGPISAQDIQNEFGGSPPISLSEYYSGGPYVAAGAGLSIPEAGQLAFGNFHGSASSVLTGAGWSLVSSASRSPSPFSYNSQRALAGSSAGGVYESTDILSGFSIKTTSAPYAFNPGIENPFFWTGTHWLAVSRGGTTTSNYTIGIMKSVDEGSTWTNVFTPINGPANPDENYNIITWCDGSYQGYRRIVLYITSSDNYNAHGYAIISDDGGNTFLSATIGMTTKYHRLNRVLYLPNANIFVGFSTGYGADGRNALISSDGKTFTASTAGLPLSSGVYYDGYKPHLGAGIVNGVAFCATSGGEAEAKGLTLTSDGVNFQHRVPVPAPLRSISSSPDESYALGYDQAQNVYSTTDLVNWTRLPHIMPIDIYPTLARNGTHWIVRGVSKYYIAPI